MATILYLDLQAGIAGDMFVAAMLQLGAPLEPIARALDGLGFGPLPVRSEPCMRGPFAALRFVVAPAGPDAHHRSHAEIARVLEAAPLPERARRRALAVFARLARAEGAVHGIPPEEVHFHEVGAVDSIVDTVGACLLLEQLGVDRVVASALPLGSGTVRAAHGRMTVPAPATLEVLTRWRGGGAAGWPTFQDGIPGERVTPTAAALVCALATPGAGPQGAMPGMRPLAVGYGAGTRDPAAIANVARVVLGEDLERPAAPPSPDRVEVLEAQVDDMPGEWIPPLIDALLGAGALDAFICPVVMKKGRPGMLITALAPEGRAEPVIEALLRHSTTLGLRRRATRREVLERRHEVVQTPFGEVRIKLGLRGGMVIQSSPEFEDCAARAREAGVPIQDVYRAALASLGAP